MEPQTGEIKVGGINYKYFQYDHVGQGARQVGSTFKPLYTLPLSNKICLHVTLLLMDRL
jgi:membrane carboxypeptidase/penicillin-binding protein